MFMYGVSILKMGEDSTEFYGIVLQYLLIMEVKIKNVENMKRK